MRTSPLHPDRVARPLIVAHRGNSSVAPENTRAAFDAARAAGADYIETDVTLSLDGVPFLIHDDTLDRTTDGSGPVGEATSGALSALDAGSWFAPWFAGARVPRLTALLDDLAVHGGRLLLEYKGRWSADHLAYTTELIHSAQLAERTVVQGFDPVTVSRLRDVAPEIPRALLVHGPALPPGLTVDRMLPVLRRLELTALNPDAATALARPELVSAMHAEGVAMLAWTVDAPDEWARLVEAGVDGIITNRPDRLAAWCTERSGLAADEAETGPAA